MKGKMDVVFERSAISLDLVSAGINKLHEKKKFEKTIDRLGTTDRTGTSSETWTGGLHGWTTRATEAYAHAS
jgi:hypothetical protein